MDEEKGLHCNEEGFDEEEFIAGLQTMNKQARDDMVRKMEQADVTDNVITTTTTTNPNQTAEEQQQLITKTDSGAVTPTEEQVLEAHKKAEAAIKPKTSKSKRKVKPRRKNA